MPTMYMPIGNNNSNNRQKGISYIKNSEVSKVVLRRLGQFIQESVTEQKQTMPYQQHPNSQCQANASAIQQILKKKKRRRKRRINPPSYIYTDSEEPQKVKRQPLMINPITSRRSPSPPSTKKPSSSSSPPRMNRIRIIITIHRFGSSHGPRQIIIPTT